MNWWKRTAMTSTAAALLVAGPILGGPAQAAGWKDVDGACHNGGVSGNTEYLWCWDKKKRVNDDTPNIDVFAFHMSLSGEATSGVLNRLWVEMDPRSTSPTQSWYSTDPRKPNQSYTTNTNCKDWSWSIGYSAGITAAYSESGTICSDKIVYEPVNNTEQGHHAGELWKSDCWGGGVTKRVTAAVLVKVAQGKVPLWDTSKHGMHQRTTRDTCRSY
jgi:hypothetical protein